MTRDDAAEQSTSEAGDIALPPQDPTYVEVTDEENEVAGYLAEWRSDEWIYTDEATTRLYDWTDHE